tara:strand:+ start:262 stop:615 length:354 start_codon:yes stop_codon:yes gene_type:complete
MKIYAKQIKIPTSWNKNPKEYISKMIFFENNKKSLMKIEIEKVKSREREKCGICQDCIFMQKLTCNYFQNKWIFNVDEKDCEKVNDLEALWLFQKTNKKCNEIDSQCSSVSSPILFQ